MSACRHDARRRRAAWPALLPLIVLVAGLAVALPLVVQLRSGGAVSDRPGEAAARAPGRLLWSGDYEVDGQFLVAPWNAEPTPPRRVRHPQARQGRYVGSYTVPAGGQRSEDVPRLRAVRPGDDLWFSFSTMLEPGLPLDARAWQVLAQWKNNGPGSPPLELALDRGRFVVGGGFGLGDGERHARVDTGRAVAGVWDDWLVHVRFASSSARARVDVWRNDRRVVDDWHPPAGTLYPGQPSHVKLGYYRSTEITTPGTVLHDDWRVGTSRRAVDPGDRR